MQTIATQNNHDWLCMFVVFNKSRTYPTIICLHILYYVGAKNLCFSLTINTSKLQHHKYEIY